MAATEKTPDYLEINDDHIVVKLKKAVEIDGAKINALTMNEPTVQNRLDMEAQKGTDADREIWMFGTLCGVMPDDLKKLTMRDYVRLQAAFQNFID